MLENIFPQNFIWLHESATKPLQRAAPHIKGTGPHVDPVAAMQNVHKPMNCYSTISSCGLIRVANLKIPATNFYHKSFEYQGDFEWNHLPKN